MTAISNLRYRVVIQRQVAAMDDIGQPLPAWIDVASVWADIRLKTGLESIRANADTSMLQASVRIRRRDDIDAFMRIVHGSSVYQIQAVLPDLLTREFTDLVCEMTR